MNKNVIRDVNNNDSIYIFCDASVYDFNTLDCHGNMKKVFISCAGAVAVINKRVVKENYRIVTDANSSRGEIEAIKDGVYLALLFSRRNPELKNFYIFSDNEIALFGIRSRIFNWKCKGPFKISYNDMKRICNGDMIYNPIYLEGSNNFICNHSIFIEILNTIVDNNLHIDFYHQKAHVSKSHKSIKQAYDLFCKNNFQFQDYNNFEFTRFISYYNDMVDDRSRDILRESVSINKLFYNQAIHFIIKDKNDYNETIKRYGELKMEV